MGNKYDEFVGKVGENLFAKMDDGVLSIYAQKMLQKYKILGSDYKDELFNNIFMSLADDSPLKKIFMASYQGSHKIDILKKCLITLETKC